jgi:ABC-type nickel/cobalt efflux system permease component RcnA
VVLQFVQAVGAPVKGLIFGFALALALALTSLLVSGFVSVLEKDKDEEELES